MSSNTYLDWDSTKLRYVQREGIETSAGSEDGNKIAITRSDTGKFDPSLIPDISGSGGVEAIAVASAVTIADRTFVNIFDSTGRKVQRAIATDGTRLASGYVGTGGTSPDSVNVTFRGPVTINTADVEGGGIVAGSLDKPVFLSALTSGMVTLTPPSASGAVIQMLGKIIEVNTGSGFFRIYLDPQMPIELS